MSDMVARFGAVELIRLTTPADQDAEAIDTVAVDRALADASALIDSYLRPRYQMPTDAAPPEIRRAACMLARYDLSMGENKEPSEQVRLARKEAIDWLTEVSRGKVQLALPAVADTATTVAQMSDRPVIFS